MRAVVWGCRGSLASPGPETVRYGGNTSCLEVRLSDNTLLVLDAGTGIRPLGVAIGADPPARIDILLTHLHIDHLEGLGFFGPLWNPQIEVHIWGPSSPTRSLEQRIGMYLSPPLFPIHLREIPSNPIFHDVPSEEWRIGGATVAAGLINHPGPTVGYRIQEDDRTLAYMPDHEPALGVEDLTTASPEWVSGVGVAYGVDTLFHDAQYTQEEYDMRVGWGHSSTEHAVNFGRLAKVRDFVMFHHDPLHSDDRLDALLRYARELWGEDQGSIQMAYEGLMIEV
ncbi:MAG: MBL fold metallo-hydrolase [Actinomycetota bacterium]